MLVIGEKEMETNSVSIRVHGQGDKGTVSVDEFINTFRKELKVT